MVDEAHEAAQAPEIEALGRLKENLQARAKEHFPTKDSIYYNGGTVAVIACTTLATLLSPSELSGYEWVPRALSGFAAFWVALERALNFGARWRFHREMRNSYNALVNWIELYVAARSSMATEQRDKYFRDIWDETYKLQHREGGIPGGSLSASEASGQ